MGLPAGGFSVREFSTPPALPNVYTGLGPFPSLPMSPSRNRPVSRTSIGLGGVVVVALLLTGLGVGAPPPTTHLSPARPGSASGIGQSVDTITTTGNWVNLTSSAGTPPEARQDYGMAYDPVLNAVVLFGGINTFGDPLGDTWEYTTTGWHNLTSSLSASPPPRWGASMTYDPSLGALLLFGGQFATGAANAYNDTWEFSASGWTELHPAESPPPEGVQLVYDAADGYAYAWGVAGTSHVQNDWAFENGDWTNLTPSVTGAPPSIAFYAAYDPQMNYVLFYGGISEFCAGGLTYSYSDGAFHNLTSTEVLSPAPIIGSGVLTYDPAADGVILFSGYNTACGITNATWEFRDGQWSNLTSLVGPAPAGRWDARLAYDPSVGGAVTFSGNENPVAGENDLGTDTWAYRVPLGVNATVSPTIGAAPLSVAFNATGGAGAAPYAYRWSFDDRTPNATVANGTHLYHVPGNYTVTLTVSDSIGDVASVSFQVQVVFAPLTVDASVSPAEGVAPFQATFNASATGGEGPYTFRWNFGDGTAVSTVANGTHTFARAGNYTVSVSVEDAYGSYVNESLRVEATQPAPPVLKPPNNSETTGLEIGIAIGIVVGAVAGGSVAYSWARRSRPTPPTNPPPAP